MSQAQQLEIDRNFEFFVGYAPKILDQHKGGYALLRNQECVAIFRTLLEAVTDASTRFRDEVYSIQEVADGPIDLGFFSHADHQGNLR
jgi:hypothetical protein